MFLMRWRAWLRQKQNADPGTLAVNNEPDRPGNGVLFAKRPAIMSEFAKIGRLDEHNMLVRHVYSANPLCVAPTTSLSDAERQMIDHCCRHSLVCLMANWWGSSVIEI